MSANTPTGAEDVYSREFLHSLIQEEFRTAMTNETHDVPTHTDGVVVLSAYEFEGDLDQPLDFSKPENVENYMRIDLGATVVMEVAAQRAGKPMSELTLDDMDHFAPPLILDGTTEQLPFMRKLAGLWGLPENKIVPIDCGAAGTANTKTQLDAVNRFADGAHPNQLSFITSAYHVPRVGRTVNQNLAEDIGFDVIQVPQSQFTVDVIPKVHGEVRRIRFYASKGDIAIRATRAAQERS